MAFLYVGGNPEGDITVVEFMDYRCGYQTRPYRRGRIDQGRRQHPFHRQGIPVLGEASEMASAFAVAVKQLQGCGL